MRIIVMSDSHGKQDAIEKIIAKNPDAAMFIHLGDGQREIEEIKNKYPQLDIRNVAGNCDFNAPYPIVMVVDTEFARILCTHGHRYNVLGGLEVLKSIALDNDCQVALYGHTHVRYNSYSDKLYVMNPGSCSCPRDGNEPSYGYIDLTNAGIVTNIVNVWD